MEITYEWRGKEIILHACGVDFVFSGTEQFYEFAKKVRMCADLAWVDKFEELCGKKKESE